MKLRNYQIDAAQFCVANKRSILRLDTGLGKTATAIEAVKRFNASRTLIIAPAFLRDNWLNELRMWGIVGAVDIMSYAAFSRGIDEDHFAMPPDVVICDEAHYLKSWSSNRTKKIVSLIGKWKPKGLMLLTATPYVRCAEDLHPLFSLCEPGKWGKLVEFRRKYCLNKPNPFSSWAGSVIWYGHKKETVGELKAASKRFMYSKSKKEVASELPEKVCTDLLVSVGKEHTLEEIDREKYVDEYGNVKGGLESKISKLNAELGLAKVKYALEWVSNTPNGEKLVVFCTHKEVAAELHKGISLENSCGVITGDTPLNKRTDIIEKFKCGEFSRVVLTIGSCGVGINLQCAALALFVELPWSFAELKQAEDRLHRIGQGSCVNIYRLVAKDTVDELIMRQIEQKYEGESLSAGVME